MRFVSWVGSLLILFYSIYPSFASAEGTKKIAVLEVYSSGSEGSLVRKMADRVRHDLARETSLVVLSREETARGLGQLVKEQGDSDQELSQIIRKSTDAYYRMELDLAKSLLKKKIREIESGELKAIEIHDLVPAYILMGTIHLAFQETTEAIRAFREVVRLSPETVLNERDHSPRVRATFERARQEVSDGKFSVGGLKVNADQKKTEVFLDGNFRGVAPLRLEQLVSGRHYLMLKREGYEPTVTPVEIPSGGILEHSFSLQEEKLDQQPTDAGILVSGSESQEEIVRKGVIAGQWLMVQQVALLQVSEESGSLSITLVNLSKPGSFVQKRGTFSNHDEAVEEGSRLVLAHFSDSTYVVQNKNSFQPVVTPEKTVKGGKPFWKKPVFWIVGGLLLAGTGTGLGLALGGGVGGGGDGTSISVELPAPVLEAK
ncbi:MAG: PEGA domain-containing protein [Deltaproteobacteria bacterium]|nr:PEGA domain-containing protein [Deltaproteobacteria bacterium]